MSSNWETYKLADLCDIGSSKRIFQHEYVDNGIPFFRSKEVIDKALGSFEPKDLLFISHDKFNEIKSKYNVPKAGELLLSSVGNRSGIPYVIKETDGDFYFKDGNLTWFRNFKKLDSDFLFYWINSSVGQNALNGIMIGSAQKALTISGLQNLTLTIPPLPIQKKIAHILSTLDDKIELNRKMNQTLEEMASAIFKSWFVDFDPVHAKANCEDEAELENIAKELGISKEILDLFPSEFIESEMGMIPKGWEVKAISSIGQVITGKTPPTTQKENYGDRYPFITIPDMHNQVYITKTERYLSDVGNNVQKNKLIPKNSLIVSCIATVGLISINSEDSHTNQQINSIVCDEKNLYYLYFILKNMKETLIMYGSSGTATLNVNKSTFENIEFIKSSDILIQRFFKFVNPIFGDILENTKQIQILEKTRDTLLPKLLSGEIDVSDLELKV